MSDQSRIWHGTDILPRQTIATELSGLDVTEELVDGFPREMADLAAKSPQAALEASIQTVESELRSALQR